MKNKQRNFPILLKKMFQLIGVWLLAFILLASTVSNPDILILKLFHFSFLGAFLLSAWIFTSTWRFSIGRWIGVGFFSLFGIMTLMGDTPNQKDDIPNFEIQDEYIVETPTETTGLSITQFQNTEHSETEEIDTELNRKIFYLISLAENIGIHLSDDKFGVGYGESFEDIKKQQDYIDQQTDFYFQKLLKKEKIDKNYIDTHKSAIVHAGILNERDTPCFHNNEVYDAYLSKAQYNTRKSKIKSAQEKEREIVLRNREKKKNNPSIAAQCSFDY